MFGGATHRFWLLSVLLLGTVVGDGPTADTRRAHQAAAEPAVSPLASETPGADTAAGPVEIPTAEEVGEDLEEVVSFAEDAEAVAAEEYLHSAAEREAQRKRIKGLDAQLEELHLELAAARVRLARWSANEYTRLDQNRLGDGMLSHTVEGVVARRVYVDAAVGRDISILDELSELELRGKHLQESIDDARTQLSRLDEVVRERKKRAQAAANPDYNQWVKPPIDSAVVKAAIDYPKNTPDAVRVAVEAATSQLGVPYRFADKRPGVGFDCSGLMLWAWGQAGVELPHSSRSQRSVTKWIEEKDLRIGDFVFYGSPIHHVEMYLGNDIVIGAPNTGRTVRYAGINSWGGVRSYGRLKFPDDAPLVDASKAAGSSKR